MPRKAALTAVSDVIAESKNCCAATLFWIPEGRVEMVSRKIIRITKQGETGGLQVTADENEFPKQSTQFCWWPCQVRSIE